MDRKFLKQIEGWQKAIVTHLATQHPELTSSQLKIITRHLLLSTLCFCLYEQRGILVNEPLQEWLKHEQVYDRLRQYWQDSCNHLSIPQRFVLPVHLAFDDCFLRLFIHDFKQASHSYSSEILGYVYEHCLGAAKKSGGAYYTPPAIVHYIIQNTLGSYLSSSPQPLIPSSPHPLHILDPTCGGGAFLLAAYDYLLDWYLNQYVTTNPELFAQLQPGSYPRILRGQEGKWRLTFAERQRILLDHIYGVDIDPEAIAITRLALGLKLLENVPDPMMRSLPDLSQTIQCGNALIASDFYDHFPQAQSDRVNPFDWHTAFPNVMPDGFDLVIGNPPYLDSEWMTLYLPDWRQYCSSRYRTAIGNWDLFCVFIEKALALCRSGGLTSLVVPNKLVSAEYAAKARSLLSQENQLLSIRDYSQVSAFSASVYPLVYITRKSPQSASIAVYETMRDLDQVNQSRWLNGWSLNSSWLITTSSDQLCLLLRLHQNFPMLETIAHVTGAATVAEAYEIQLIIQEKSTVESGDLRLVNSGTLDRYTLLWGNKRLRYLGRSYWHPVICESECDRLPPKRYQQARQPKIIIAGMTQRLECALDETGTMLAGKSTTLIMNRLSFAIDLRYLLGLLNSRLINFYFASHFSGNRLQGNYLRVGSPQLRKIPICIPDFDNAAARHNYDRMIDLVNEMLTQHNEQIDQEIDHLVYKLYRLSDAEIELVT